MNDTLFAASVVYSLFWGLVCVRLRVVYGVRRAQLDYLYAELAARALAGAATIELIDRVYRDFEAGPGWWWQMADLPKWRRVHFYPERFGARYPESPTNPG